MVDGTKLVDTIRAAQKRIKDIEQKKARLTGELDALMGRLKNDFGCETIGQADTELFRLQKSKEEKEKRLVVIEKEMQSLMSQMGTL